ncbi:hypothetical protein TNCV_3141421 [Trichonephila clavipes]|nr:hypothetical protein TNCV_3141421 [Trichonephila clavipes]
MMPGPKWFTCLWILFVLLIRFLDQQVHQYLYGKPPNRGTTKRYRSRTIIDEFLGELIIDAYSRMHPDWLSPTVVFNIESAIVNY